MTSSKPNHYSVSNDDFELFCFSKKFVFIKLFKVFKGVTNIIDKVSAKQYADDKPTRKLQVLDILCLLKYDLLN